MERLVLMTPTPKIRVEDLPQEVRSGTQPTDPGSATLDEARKQFERGFLAARLEEHGGNVSRTAEAIGIARESLSRKLKSFGIKAQRD